MEHAERVFDLAGVCANGWLEEMAGESDDFKKVFDAIGKRTVGLSLVAGVRIQGLSIDPQLPENAVVQFSIGEGTDAHSLPIYDFRRRVGAAVLAPSSHDDTLGAEPTPEDLQAFIGGRQLLIAALFGLEPLELRVIDDHAMLVVRFGDLERKLNLDDFRVLLADRVRDEMGVQGVNQQASVDLNVLEEAIEATEQADWEGTIAALSPWLTPVSMLMRSGESEALESEVHDALSRGLGLLGTAYANAGNIGAAHEVLRLGVQWAGDRDAAKDMFLRLGDASVQSGQFGEAIGLLRRARSLGSADRDVMPLLATCFAARNQYLAAVACREAALRDGVPQSAIDPDIAACEQDLGAPWGRFTAYVGRPDS